MHEPDIIEFYDDQRADTFRWGQCKFLAFGGLLGLGQMFLFAVILLVTQNLQGVLTVGSAKPSGGQTVIVMLIAHWFLLNKLQWGFEFRALDAEVEQDHLIYLQINIDSLPDDNVCFLDKCVGLCSDYCFVLAVYFLGCGFAQR